ncbi:MAG TPA: hypothetical protein VKZ18_09585 [Polyangia bacterium]|nr:hypothetical protein [Polyangia bacterium]
MNLEIENLQLQLPVRGAKHAEQLVALVKESLARLPPLPPAARDLRIPALAAQDLRFKPGASDPEIAEAVAASIHRALVQAIGEGGGGASARAGRVAAAADTAPAAATSARPPAPAVRPPAPAAGKPAGRSSPGKTGKR